MPSPRVDAVDAMRGLAALAVVIYHARVEFWTGLAEVWRAHGINGGPEVWLGYLSAPFSFGWFGVQLFFVLSGYCIHRRAAQQLAATGSAKVDWRLFYARRAMRIYPIYIVALILTAIVSEVEVFFGYEPVGVDRSAATFAASLATLQGVAAPIFGWNGVFWTLSIEVHLYIFYPVLLHISRRSGPYSMLALSLAISAAYIAADYYFEWTEKNPFSYGITPSFLAFVFMWTVGAFIAEVETGRAKLPQGLGPVLLWLSCLLVGIFMIDGELWGRKLAVLSCLPLGVASGGAVVLGLRWGNKVSGEAGKMMRRLALLGGFSYSLYASHVVTFHVLKILGVSGGSMNVIVAISAALAAVIVGYLLYRLVERPSIVLAGRLRG